ncbi:Putrescine transport system permease protein PotH [Pseudomonas fluorescens]|nr:Putrescine transport system permease protein PotH [Pseudomonas fluorescens]
MLPFFLVMKISFSEAALSIPPYSEIYTYAEQKFQLLLNIGNYTMLGEDELYLSAYLGSLKVAALSTMICLLIGYPMAYAITNTRKEPKTSCCC